MAEKKTKKGGRKRAAASARSQKKRTTSQARKTATAQGSSAWPGLAPAERKQPIRRLLIPLPDTPSSPYKSLARKYELEVILHPYLQIEPMTAKEFRRQKIHLPDYKVVIFTNRYAIDNYFRLAQELNTPIPADTKFICLTERIAYYIQKYMPFRKRRIFWGTGTTESILELAEKYKNLPFLYPSSDKPSQPLVEGLRARGIDVTVAPMYRAIYCDLSHLDLSTVDLFAFFTPKDVEALLHNYPDLAKNQGQQLVAVFGPRTEEAAHQQGLRVDIKAPTEGVSSLSTAITQYLNEWYETHHS